MLTTDNGHRPVIDRSPRLIYIGGQAASVVTSPGHVTRQHVPPVPLRVRASVCVSVRLHGVPL